MSEAEKTEFPEEFVEYAKRKIAEDEEFVRHIAKFGSPLLKKWMQMVLDAAGEKCTE